MAQGHASGALGRARLHAQVEHGLDARHARLLRRRAGSTHAAPPRADLRAAVRVQRAVRAAAQPRRGGARQGQPAARCRRRLAALRQSARCTHGCGRAGAPLLHGRRAGSWTSGTTPRLPGTCSTAPHASAGGSRDGVAWPAVWERDHERGGFQWLDADDADRPVLAFLRWPQGGAHAVACVANLGVDRAVGHRVGLPWPGEWEVVLDTGTAAADDAGGSPAPGEPVRDAEPRRLVATDEPWQGQPASARGRAAAARRRLARRAPSDAGVMRAGPIARGRALRRDPAIAAVLPACVTLAVAVGVFAVSFGVGSVAAGASVAADLRAVAARLHRRLAVLRRQRDRRRRHRRRSALGGALLLAARNGVYGLTMARRLHRLVGATAARRAAHDRRDRRRWRRRSDDPRVSASGVLDHRRLALRLLEPRHADRRAAGRRDRPRGRSASTPRSRPAFVGDGVAAAADAHEVGSLRGRRGAVPRARTVPPDRCADPVRLARRARRRAGTPSGVGSRAHRGSAVTLDPRRAAGGRRLLVQGARARRVRRRRVAGSARSLPRADPGGVDRRTGRQGHVQRRPAPRRSTRAPPASARRRWPRGGEAPFIVVIVIGAGVTAWYGCSERTSPGRGSARPCSPEISAERRRGPGARAGCAARSSRITSVPPRTPAERTAERTTGTRSSSVHVNRVRRSRSIGVEREPTGAGDEAGVAHAHRAAGLPLGDLHPVDQPERTDLGVAQEPGADAARLARPRTGSPPRRASSRRDARRARPPPRRARRARRSRRRR